ncbi:MAG: four helix bundle protein [Pirellulales bacterium]
MAEKQFRFEELDIWKKAPDFSLKLFELAEGLEQRKYFRFAEQLRGATLSITNNIAEGSGSQSRADFANFLNIARRSVFGTANLIDDPRPERLFFASWPARATHSA